MSKNNDETIETRCNKCNEEFKRIIAISKNFTDLSCKTYKNIKLLNKLYLKLTNLNEDELELFGLDYINFQYEIYIKKFKNLKEIYKYLNNRIYGDYFKLYKLLSNYVNNEIHDKTILDALKNSTITPYKPLENSNYSEEILTGLHSFILNVINMLNKLYETKINNCKNKEALQLGGLCIGNYVETIQHKNSTILKKIQLFIGFIDFFNANHNKILSELELKMRNINEELKYKDSLESFGIKWDEDDGDKEDFNIFGED